MTSLLFLAIGVGVAVVGILLLWLFSRETKHFDTSIRDFQKEMGALDPETMSRKRGRHGP